MYILCLQNIFHPISVSRKEGDPLSKAYYDCSVYLYSSVFRLLRSFCYSLKWHTLIMHSIFHIIVKKTGFLDWSKHWLKFFCIFLQNINHTLFKENIDKASSFFISLGSIMCALISQHAAIIRSPRHLLHICHTISSMYVVPYLKVINRILWSKPSHSRSIWAFHSLDQDWRGLYATTVLIIEV